MNERRIKALITELQRQLNIEPAKPKINKMQAKQIIADQRKKLAEAKKDAEDKGFVLIVTDEKGEKIKKLTGLNWDEAFRQRRDWYKILVLNMKQKVSMEIKYEDKKVG